MNKLYYKCLSDPFNEYIGYEMTSVSFRRLLKEGSLPPGSVWMNSLSGQRYAVVGNERWYRMASVLEVVPHNVHRERQDLIKEKMK